MIRFALIVASTLGFFLTAALGNLMVPLLRAFGPGQAPKTPPQPEAQDAADGVLLGRFGQAVAAGLAAQTGQVALLDKALHDGLQILFGNFLPCGDLAVVLVLGNINHNTQRITALR